MEIALKRPPEVARAAGMCYGEVMDISTITPFEGLGDLKFGLSRQAVRDLLGPDVRSYRKNKYEPRDTDSYRRLGLHLYYDADDRLEFIETTPPSDPTFQGVHLRDADLGRVLARLADQGYHATEDDAGYNFKDLGIGLYVPESAIEAVSVYRRGYYDDALS